MRVSKKLLLLVTCGLISACSPESSLHFRDVPEETFRPKENEAIEEVIWTRVPQLSGWWNEMPSIRVCTETKIQKTRVETALRFWERQGYTFDEVTMDEFRNRNRSCTPRPFEILFRLPTQEDLENGLNSGFLACTLASRNIKNSEIVYSEIFFISVTGPIRPRMMEHEIGHALGWMHTNTSYHIMHPEYNKTGATVRGVRYDDYILRREEIRETTQRGTTP